MGKKKIEIPIDNNIIPVPIAELMPDNYLPYAVEVAKERALPDVRDGLKPVHRRILYGAYKLKAMPDKPYYKSARIVGDILGKYHPHGDTSVYDAMVILAQSFTTRMPLIDGHGNWGSVDGDNAAAMRYTEARLTNIALEMLSDIDKDVVEMVNNYSDTELEPKVLPAKFPGLLVNGAFGIAVGLATNIPPHNLKEVIDGTIALIDNKELTTKEIMEYIKGPDLPTGGTIIGKNALLAAYETGDGKVTLRAKTSIEKLENDRYGIIIHEFPYRRNKAKLLQSISEMTADKRHSKNLEAIIDIRDESDRNGIRSVIELKKSVDLETAEMVLKYLFKKTDLQCNLSFNMVAIADGRPQLMGIKEILSHYVAHQKEVITRRTQKELEMAEKRFHIVEGFIEAISIIDEIIAVIKSSKSKSDSETNVMNEFGFTQIQAQAIVELMLYRLTTLEINVFEKEYKQLEKKIKGLKKILGSEKELRNVIKKELLEVRDKYGDDRRTKVIENDEEAKIDVEELVLEEDIVITMSNEGYIKRISEKSYKRSNTNVDDIEYREGDFNKFLFNANTKNTLIMFTNLGNMYQIKSSLIPEMKWKEKGEKIDDLIKSLDLERESIIDVYNVDEFSKDKYIMFFTSQGMIKKISLDKFKTSYSKLVALKLRKEEKLVDVKLCQGEFKEKYVKVRTMGNLDFTVELSDIEESDRNLLGAQVCNISSNDRITQINYTDYEDYKDFKVGVDKAGILKIVQRANSKKFKVTNTNSKKTLLIFGNKGNVFKISSNMIQNIDDTGIELSQLVDEYDSSEEIIEIFSIEDFQEDYSLFFFSKRGYVKRTLLKEFSGDYMVTKGYKIKFDDDELMEIIISKNDIERDITLITRNAMCIRFDRNSVGTMGKIASGVIGISVKEGDEVVYATLINKESLEDEIALDKENTNILQLISKNNIEEKIDFKNIKVQNRAGRGGRLILLELDDYLKNVIEK